MAKGPEYWPGVQQSHPLSAHGVLAPSFHAEVLEHYKAVTRIIVVTRSADGVMLSRLTFHATSRPHPPQLGFFKLPTARGGGAKQAFEACEGPLWTGPKHGARP